MAGDDSGDSPGDVDGSNDRRVKFHEDQKLTHEFDDSDLWIHGGY